MMLLSAVITRLEGYRAMPVSEGEVLTLPVRVAVPRDALDTVKTSVTIRVQARDNPDIHTEHTTTFIGPALRSQ